MRFFQFFLQSGQKFLQNFHPLIAIRWAAPVETVVQNRVLQRYKFACRKRVRLSYRFVAADCVLADMER